MKECSVQEDDTDTLRKMSASSYPERKQSASVTHLANEMAASQNLHSVPEFAGHGDPSHGLPSYGVPNHGVPNNGVPSYGDPHNGLPSYGDPSYGVPSYDVPSYGVPQYPAPLTSSISLPMLYPQQSHMSEDPTDTRPSSIWI